MNSEFLMLFYLFGFHYVADFPLQGQFLSDAKNHKKPIPGISWPQCLTAHAFIQGMFVAFLTQSVILGLAEFVIHWIVDYARSDGKISFDMDQSIHLLCKLLWWILAVFCIQ